jgi:hypothetical protein
MTGGDLIGRARVSTNDARAGEATAAGAVDDGLGDYLFDCDRGRNARAGRRDVQLHPVGKRERVAERALLAAQRPVLIPSREDDPPEQIHFVDDVVLRLPGHSGIAKLKDENLYLAMALRNGGAGLAVIHSWHVETDFEKRQDRPADLERFRRQTRDLYIPAGSSGFWQGAIRDRDDPDYEALRAMVERGERVFVDLIYGDYEGGQRTIARFTVPSRKDESGARTDVVRYWNLDGDDPR